MPSLKVCLVENNNPFADAGSDTAAVKTGIQTRLRDWYHRVLAHRNASTGRPAGYNNAADVSWTDVNSLRLITGIDLVVYFSPTSGLSGSPQTVHHGPYKTAAGQIADARLRAAVVAAIGSDTRGGHTIRASLGDRMIPILSEVFVLYDAQLSIRNARIEGNVQTLAASAFHETGHNKSSRLHEDGGGAVFAAQYSGAQLSPANVAFFAQSIWTWGPQYVIGQALTPVAPP